MLPTYSIKAKHVKSGHSPNSYSGPYWYAYWRNRGKLVCTYLGKEIPADVESRIAEHQRRLNKPLEAARPSLFEPDPEATPSPVVTTTGPELLMAEEFVKFCERFKFVPAKGREAARKHVHNLMRAISRNVWEKTLLWTQWLKYRKCFPALPRLGASRPAPSSAPTHAD